MNATWQQDIEMLTLEQLENEIEVSWYMHLELRNEVYEMDMGPSDVLDVYISCHKSTRSSMSRNDLNALMESNFNYHVALRDRFYAVMNIKGDKRKLAM